MCSSDLLPLEGEVGAPAQIAGKLTLNKKQSKRFGLGRKKTTLAKDADQVAAAGAYSLEFEFSKLERRKLKKAGQVTFGVKVTAQFGDGTADKSRGKLTLKR